VEDIALRLTVTARCASISRVGDPLACNADKLDLGPPMTHWM
jgi:hypothetical protein